METQHWVDEAGECGYLDSKRVRELTEELQQIGRVLNSMMDKAHSFCRQSHVAARDDGTDH